MIKTARLPALVRRKIRPRRRKSVSALRIILPVVAVGVCVAIGSQAAIRAAESRASAAAAAGVPLKMDNPRFTGAMRDGREFLITATSAIRDKDNTDKVALVGPKLTRGYGSENPTQVVSQQGVYDESTSALLLTGNVQIDNGDGYAFSTQKAVIDTRTGQVMGDSGVQGQGVQGNKVRADSYSVTDKGDRVTFKGRVRTRLNPGN
jgi:lipopolysaccharide export system protein LptC